MAFDKIILGAITRTVKSTARFDIAINSLQAKFDQGCPTPQELNNIIQSKNQINTALTQALSALNTINTTAGTVNGIVTSINNAITTIKALPFPSAITPLAPAGVGPSLIPGRIFPILSDALIILRDFIKTNKGLLDQVPSAISSIREAIQGVISNLNSLDAQISRCLEQQISNLSPEAKEAYFNEIGFSVSQTGISSNPNVNINVDKALEDQLKPNSNNPLFYKDFLLTLEYDSSNTFSFPSRRIKGINNLTKRILYNYGGKFSYSASTQVLFDEIKFQIDRLTPPQNEIEDIKNIIDDVTKTVDDAQKEAEKTVEDARRAAEEAARKAIEDAEREILRAAQLKDEEDRRIEAERLARIERLKPFGIEGYANEIKPEIFSDGRRWNYYIYRLKTQKWELINTDLFPFNEPGIKNKETRNYIYTKTQLYKNPSPGFPLSALVNASDQYLWDLDTLTWKFIRNNVVFNFPNQYDKAGYQKLN
jgi:uncharacterized protein YoxC